MGSEDATDRNTRHLLFEERWTPGGGRVGGAWLAILTACLLAAGVTVAAGVVATQQGGETDQHGQAHAWKGPSDGYTVIDFAASWCAPCWKSLPKLQGLAAKHPDLRVLVVSVDDEERGRDRLVAALDLSLPVLWDARYAIAEHYAPPGMPATYLLDPAGTVVHQHVGSNDEEWERFARLVAEVSP